LTAHVRDSPLATSYAVSSAYLLDPPPPPLAGAKIYVVVPSIVMLPMFVPDVVMRLKLTVLFADIAVDIYAALDVSDFL